MKMIYLCQNKSVASTVVDIVLAYGEKNSKKQNTENAIDSWVKLSEARKASWREIYGN